MTPTSRQMDVLLEVVAGSTDGFTPTLDEIGARLGVKKATVWSHMKRLEQDGYVEQGPRREYVATDKGREAADG